MLLSDLTATAVRDVGRSKSRTFLTILGIIIGVAAVVMMTGVGRSMERVILSQISALGPKTIAVWPGSQGPEGGPGSVRADFDKLTIRDVDALRKLPSLTNVSPMLYMPGSVTAGKEKSQPRIVGVPPEYFASQSLEVTAGRVHDQSDEQGARAVAVIGSDVARDLFLNRNPLGQRLEVGNKRFTVIGVLKPVGSQFFQNMDDRIIVPFSVAKESMQRTYVDMLTADAVGDTDEAVRDVQDLLRRRHGLHTPADGGTGNDDFLVRTAVQAQQILGSVSLALTVFITMIAAISLVVGGIGIMNIMLVAVTERTREIGLRKALGARRRDILTQFLVEAVVLTLLGGLIGLLFGASMNFLIANIAHRFLERYVFALSVPGIILSLIMAGVTGIAFGIYPARRAAALDPIEALRYE